MLNLVTELFILLFCWLGLVAASEYRFKKLIVLGLLLLALDDSIKESGVYTVTATELGLKFFVFGA